MPSAVISTPTLFEACCDSVASARDAQELGAGRIELCGAGAGGTTPSLGLIARCRDEIYVPLHVMIRPHVGDFNYTSEDLDVMKNDIVAARALGVDGIVIGILRGDHTVDVERMADVMQLARPLKVTFHRAFDRTPDSTAALDALLLLGVDYVLTSGQAASALDGVDSLHALRQQAGDRLTILAGGGVRAHNVRDVVRRSGVREVHANGTNPEIVRDVMLALSAG
jgi:copper homeostasis protein